MKVSMKKLRRAMILCLFLALGLGAAWYLQPRFFQPSLLQLNQKLSGLTKKSVLVDDHRIVYLEGGSGDTVVLLHGIFSEKDHWVDFARSLTGKYRIIIPDIPAFGESTRLSDASYDYADQVLRLKAFFDALELGPFHIAGNSMGGTLAALYSLEQPERIKSLAFIGAPHGIKTPLPSSMDDLIEQGKFPLVVRTAEEFESMLDLLFFKRPFLPYPILKESMDAGIRQADDNEKIFRQQLKDRYLLHEKLQHIKHPLLTLWGEGERIFHPSGAQVLKEIQPEHTLVVMSEAGHLPQMEKPRETATLYLNFLMRHP
jgi:pimeloyl-ACP methyl ester carboxylesterase